MEDLNNLNTKFFCYKGKPLIRSGNTLYYGSMLDDYVVMLQVMNTRTENDTELSNDILVQLMRTGKDVKPQDIIVKKSERNGMCDAIEIAEIWLRKALSPKKVDK